MIYKIFFMMLLASGASVNPKIDSAIPSGASSMTTYVLRLFPGDDPKVKLQNFVNEKKLKAVIILSAVGSLTTAVIRYANEDNSATLTGHFEVVSLVGTLGSTSGSHIHISVSDKTGKTLGGHLEAGSKVYTTLEVALGSVNEVEFRREHDPVSTYDELKIYSVKK